MMQTLNALTSLKLGPGTPSITSTARPAPSPNQGPRFDKISQVSVERPHILVLHYTACPLPETLSIFRTPDKVSAHYTLDDNGDLYSHVPETANAWHAGVSYWDGIRNINPYTLGIENVNLGYVYRESCEIPRLIEGDDVQAQAANAAREQLWTEIGEERARGEEANEPPTWVPFEEIQIQKLVELTQELVKKYDIKPHHVVGHSDVCQPYNRKVDPGPLFPWQRLAKAGVGAWPKAELMAEAPTDINYVRARDCLIKIGYQVEAEASANALKAPLKAFQMHYRPASFEGQLDEETAQILSALASDPDNFIKPSERLKK